MVEMNRFMYLMEPSRPLCIVSIGFLSVRESASDCLFRCDAVPLTEEHRTWFLFTTTRRSFEAFRLHSRIQLDPSLLPLRKAVVLSYIHSLCSQKRKSLSFYFF